jgi:hypothetical protein
MADEHVGSGDEESTTAAETGGGDTTSTDTTSTETSSTDTTSTDTTSTETTTTDTTSTETSSTETTTTERTPSDDTAATGDASASDDSTTDGNTTTDVELPPVHRFARRLNRAYHRRLGRRTHDPGGVDVVAEDWDVLVVLDACRYDLFAATHDFDGTVERRRSRGSHTVEWLWGNFVNRQLHDTVYVTANVQPHVYRTGLDCHHVEHAWVDGFDEERRTVPPATTTDAAVAAADRFPRKRLVVHYLQPHYPFAAGPAFEYGTMSFWDAVAAGAVDASATDLRAWQTATLEWVLPEVHRLLDAVTGRAVVTSDHGTMLGERAAPVPVREWGHPWGLYVPPLVEVPWLVVDDDRRPVESDPPAEGGGSDEAAVREQLAALGYR